MGNSNTKTKEEPSSYQKAEGKTKSLEYDTDEHDTAADHNTGTSTQDIGHIWNEWNSTD